MTYIPNPVLTMRKKVRGITIDPNSAKDFDDAIWIEGTSKALTIYISIADVGSVVPRFSTEDQLAITQGFTHYNKNDVKHMYPKDIVPKLSLIPGENRPTISVIATLDKNTQITKASVHKTYVRSERQYTYVQAEDSINAGNKFNLQTAYEIAKKLFNKRRDQGALTFLNEEVNTTHKGRDGLSERIIEEFSILANRIFAQTLKQSNTGIFRYHKEMKDISREDIIKEYNKGDQGDMGNVLHRGRYRADPDFHYGLKLDTYTHSTSPIRRYADTINMRLISDILDGKPPSYTKSDLTQIADHLTQVEGNLKRRKNTQS